MKNHQLSICWVAIIFLFEFGTALNLYCWHCENARSNAECLEKGYLETCHQNQPESCQNEVRLRGKTLNINKRCKQQNACQNNEIQNRLQCRRGLPVTICRCCCDTNSCNKDKLMCDIREPPKDIFNSVDLNYDGQYSSDDVVGILTTAGIQQSADELQMVMGHFDNNNDGSITMEEFNEVVADDINRKIWDWLRPPEQAIIQNSPGLSNETDLFTTAAPVVIPVKINQENITVRGYQSMMSSIGIRLKGTPELREIARKLHAKADADGDGEVRYKEYGRLSFTADTVSVLFEDMFVAGVDPAKTMAGILSEFPSCPEHECTAELLDCETDELKIDPYQPACTLCECMKFDFCKKGPCFNNATCINTPESPEQGFQCECQEGFSGEFCELSEGISRCQTEYQQNLLMYKMYPNMQDGPELQECDENGDFKRKQCHLKKYDGIHNHVEACWCVHPKEGFMIFGTETAPGMGHLLDCDDLCEPNTCVPDVCDSLDCLGCETGLLKVDGSGCSLCECVEPSPCDSSPCINGGTCEAVDTVNFFCMCPEEFIGEFCEQDALSLF